jgi:hypothetical protein
MTSHLPYASHLTLERLLTCRPRRSLIQTARLVRRKLMHPSYFAVLVCLDLLVSGVSFTLYS